jgi:hypothetical protein
VEPNLALWREKQWWISYLQANSQRTEFNEMPAKDFVRCGSYKNAITIAAAMASEASAGGVKWDLENGYTDLHLPPKGQVPGPLCWAMVAKPSTARGR